MVQFLDPQLQARFEREGYVTVPLLDAPQIAEARAAITLHLGDRQLERNVGDASYTSMLDTEVATNDIHDLLAGLVGPRVLALLDDARLLSAAVMTKPPHAGKVDLHQHQPLSNAPFAATPFCWVPLADCNAEDGAMVVAPRSHRLYRHIRLVHETEYFSDYRAALWSRYVVTVPLRAGEAIIFDNSLIHGSVPNRTGDFRMAVVSVYAGRQEEHAFYTRENNGGVRVSSGFEKIQALAMVSAECGHDETSTGVRHLPPWDHQATLHEFEHLIAANLRATEDFDPLEAIRPTIPPEPVRYVPRPLAPWMPKSLKRLAPKAARKFVRGVVDARRKAALSALTPSRGQK